MKKFSGLLLILLFFASVNIFAQGKAERQHRIKKSQFPSKALETIEKNSDAIKRLKYYQEVDTAQKTYTAKFKKYRLFYEVDFVKNGEFKSMGFKVKQVDIPDDSFERIENYLSQHFEKFKIRKMFQLYLKGEDDNPEKTIKSAFQNLITPDIFYKLLIRGKKDGKAVDYTTIFDSDGNFKQIQRALPPNYDRILY